MTYLFHMSLFKIHHFARELHLHAFTEMVLWCQLQEGQTLLCCHWILTLPSGLHDTTILIEYVNTAYKTAFQILSLFLRNSNIFLLNIVCVFSTQYEFFNYKYLVELFHKILETGRHTNLLYNGSNHDYSIKFFIMLI